MDTRKRRSAGTKITADNDPGTETGNLIYAAVEDGRNPYYRTDPTPWQLNAEYGEAFSNMRATHRYLLEFFLCETSRIISCHQDVRNNLCRAVIPMAMEEPCLLSAVLAVSGNYFISSGASSSHVDPTLIANLSNSSIAGLRSAFNKQAPVTAATLATAMFLCLYDIHSGIGATGSWRVHFQGARAIMSSLGHSSAVLYSKNQRTSWRILAQMYISIELIGSLTIKGLPMRQYSRLSLHANHIDEYFGVSTGLLDILREVGAAAAKRRRMDRDSGYLGMLPYDDLLQEADSLEQSVRSMMALKRTTPTPFHPRMEELLSPEEKHEYQLCNEAYQHTALINIHSCIRLLPGLTPKVQTSVQRILEIADQMKSTSGMSPWLLMATPLFTAGSYAFGPDRDRMRDLFTTFQRTIRIANYQRSLELLETYWKESDQGSAQDIEFVIGLWKPFDIV